MARKFEMAVQMAVSIAPAALLLPFDSGSDPPAAAPPPDGTETRSARANAARTPQQVFEAIEGYLFADPEVHQPLRAQLHLRPAAPISELLAEQIQQRQQQLQMQNQKWEHIRKARTRLRWKAQRDCSSNSLRVRAKARTTLAGCRRKWHALSPAATALRRTLAAAS